MRVDRSIKTFLVPLTMLTIGSLFPRHAAAERAVQRAVSAQDSRGRSPNGGTPLFLPATMCMTRTSDTSEMRHPSP
jgi:hypothetical protein